MASYNKVIFMGNLTRDFELKYLPSGTAVAESGIAMNRSWTDKETGEKKEEVCFVDIKAWGRTAEVLSEYFSKGKPIFFEGRLVFRSWETDDGQKRSKHEAMVERFTFTGSRQDDDNGNGNGAAPDGFTPPPQGEPASAPASER